MGDWETPSLFYYGSCYCQLPFICLIKSVWKACSYKSLFVISLCLYTARFMAGNCTFEFDGTMEKRTGKSHDIWAAPYGFEKKVLI